MLLVTLITLLTLNTVRPQKQSPCPSVLIYEPRNLENDRWYAVVNLSTRESLRGLWLTISLDRKAELLGNIFGDAATSNNRDFLIKSNNYVLEAGSVTPVRFFVKYDSAGVVPSVKEINLNGRTICSTAEDQNADRNSARPSSSTRRPTNSNGRPGSVTTGRPAHSNSQTSSGTLHKPSNTNSRPTVVHQEDARPVKPLGPDFRPSIEDLDTNKPNRLSNTNQRPTSFNNDAEGNIPSRPSTITRPSTFNGNSEESRPNRPRPSSFNGDSEELRPNRPSTNSRPSTFNGDYEEVRPNRPSTSIRPSINTDDLDVERPNWSPNNNNRPTEELGTVRPNRPLDPYGNVDHEDPATNYRPETSSNGYNQGATTFHNRYNGGSSNVPTYGTNREQEGNSGSNNYNQGSSSLSAPQDNDDFFAGDFSAIVSRPPSNPSTRPSVQRNQRCGIVAAQPRPLISYGQDTEPGQWPWHAALYHSKGIQLMYTCGGTLISTSHIVTAAHCVTKPRTNRPINPQNILAYLGKYNLRKFGSEIQDREVGDIYIHPQYNYSGYYNDIAILRLSEPVEITNYVRPVCLWDEHTDLNEVEGKLGTVVGWGFNENGVLTTTLMQAQMPIVSLAKCIFSNRDFFSQFTSEKSFCAGFRNGTSVCNGDSGGGMVFPRRGTSGANTVWQIRGLVSVGVAFQGKIICDTSQYVVFTDVAKHLNWIQTILNNYP